ncbi:MAG: hypothetical protein R3324_11150, partial [Halobacteriales archaeon]|nr:hypothetical protein [Halobacteriales archaeon]
GDGPAMRTPRDHAARTQVGRIDESTHGVVASTGSYGDEGTMGHVVSVLPMGRRNDLGPKWPRVIPTILGDGPGLRVRDPSVPDEFDA